MALNPNIILSGRGPDIIGGAQQGLNLRSQFEQAPLRNQLLQQGVEQGQQNIDIGQQNIQAGQQAIQQEALNRQVFGARKAISAFEKGNIPGVIDSIREAFPGDDERINAEIQELQADPALYISQAQNDVDSFDAQRLKTATSSAAQREFESLSGGLSEDDLTLAKRIELGLSPRAVGSAAQTITGTGAAADVAQTEEILATGKASGKAKGEARQSTLVANAKAEIATAVKLATTEATARGETLTDLNRANASLPGLINVVDQLKELAPIATSTLGGRVFDTAVKESGFGSTKGADARAKFVGIINNQVLPLLKQTFGAAFTFPEGEALKATMGDADASPSEKIVQLDAFIEGKTREIQSKERELGQEVTPTASLLDPVKRARLDELRAKAGF